MTNNNKDLPEASVQIPEYKFEEVPAELDERMARLFMSMRQEELSKRAEQRRRKIIQVRSFAAAGLVMILFVSLIGPNKVWTAGWSTLDVVIRTVKSFSSLEWNDKPSPPDAIDISQTYNFSYLPEDMTLVYENGDSQLRMTRFETDTGDYILATQYSTASVTSIIDTEQSNVRMQKEGERLYYYYLNKDMYNIIWEEHGQSFNLSSSLDFDILFEVARGLSPVQ